MANVVEFIYRLQDRVSGAMEKVARSAERVQTQMAKTQQQTERLGDSIGDMATQYLSFAAAAMAGRAFVKMGMDMEQTRIKFEVMLGSAELGNRKIAELQRLAEDSPYGTTELKKATETLLGFGYSAEKVVPALRMLGDVAMGNRERLQSLTLAFAQTSAAGRLTGQEVLQMVNQGFNPLAIISEQTGRSMAELRDEMAAGRISVQMVEDALRHATSEGGRFYNMSGRISGTAGGKIATFMEKLTKKLTELAERLNPVIGRIMDVGIAALKHFDAVARVVWAALIPVRALITGLAELFKFFKNNGAILAVTVTLLAGYKLAAYQVMLATKGLTIQAVLASKAFQILNVTLLKNPFTAALVGLTLLVGGLVMLRNRSREAADGLDEINRRASTYSSDERARLDMIFSKLRQTNPKTKERNELVKQLQDMYPDVLKNMNLEKAGLEELATAYDSIVLSINNKARARAYEDQLTELHKEKDIAEKEGKEEIEWIQAMLDRGVGEKTLRMQPVKVKYKGKSFSGSDAFDKLDNLRRINAEMARILEAANRNYKENPLKKLDGGGNDDPLNQTDTSISGLTGAGSRPTNITINLRNLVEYLNMYPQTVREGVADVEGQLIEGLLRVVNSANRIAVR